MTQKFPRLFFILLAALFVLNLLQSYFTELIYDEAYYWYYAQTLDWGYFDHPPMVAFLIKLSSLFFEGELGVRFMSCVLSIGTYVFLWLLIENPKKNDYVIHFFLLLFSMTLMNAYGFLTLPDTPLLFFTALFLWLYKCFLKNPTIWISLFLGVVMAALMYSKYHAVLVILFVFLSNFKLIGNRKAWLAVAVALICYIPHFLWLYQHDFISIKYHLFERPNQAYSFEKFTLGYLINLVAIFGLLFYWVYLALLKTKKSDTFTRALKYLTYGVLLFFFISSFNRRVQTQWIIVISIPMAVLAFNYLLENGQSRKWMYRMGIASLVILLYARVWLIFQPLVPLLFETHGNKQWVEALSSKADGVPVVFENSYRRAPMYEF
ncbi:MAG: ArnT family glycosyltransferase, partial [Allomuricauda sp.]